MVYTDDSKSSALCMPVQVRSKVLKLKIKHKKLSWHKTIFPKSDLISTNSSLSSLTSKFGMELGIFTKQSTPQTIKIK